MYATMSTMVERLPKVMPEGEEVEFRNWEGYRSWLGEELGLDMEQVERAMEFAQDISQPPPIVDTARSWAEFFLGEMNEKDNEMFNLRVPELMEKREEMDIETFTGHFIEWLNDLRREETI